MAMATNTWSVGKDMATNTINGSQGQNFQDCQALNDWLVSQTGSPSFQVDFALNFPAGSFFPKGFDTPSAQILLIIY